MEKTLVLIKPDAVERNLIGEIISMYEKEDLVISDIKKIRATEEIARKHYCEHCERPYFDELISYITRGDVVAMIIKGNDAISKVRRINGATNPEEALEGTIRKKYALSKNENCVHASDSKESANREMALWFSEF